MLSQEHRLYIVTNAVASAAAVPAGRQRHCVVYHRGLYFGGGRSQQAQRRLFLTMSFPHIDGIARDNCLLVGDSLSSDIRGANNAGIPCCWYNPKRRLDRE